jgi:hypothetical protein
MDGVQRRSRCTPSIAAYCLRPTTPGEMQPLGSTGLTAIGFGLKLQP